MNEETISEENVATEATEETITTEPSQSPIEEELEREQKKEGRSEAEKATFSLKKLSERARELGIDPAEVLGFKKETVDKETPLTVGMYEQMQREVGQKTSLQLAEGITDQHERDLVISYLKTRVVPSGDPADDVRFARLAVNSVKNGQIAEEIGRSTQARSHSSSAGAPPATTTREPELTAQEQMFTKAPFNMTPAEVIKARPQQ